jgi:hypothetical protein
LVDFDKEIDGEIDSDVDEHLSFEEQEDEEVALEGLDAFVEVHPAHSVSLG